MSSFNNGRRGARRPIVFAGGAQDANVPVAVVQPQPVLQAANIPVVVPAVQGAGAVAGGGGPAPPNAGGVAAGGVAVPVAAPVAVAANPAVAAPNPPLRRSARRQLAPSRFWRNNDVTDMAPVPKQPIVSKTPRKNPKYP